MEINRSNRRPLVGLLVLTVLSCAPMSVPPSNRQPDPEILAPPSTHTLQGTFTAPQQQDGPSPLRAVFTSTWREQHWKVVFHFQFNGAQYAFRGIADGSLEEGLLRGTVHSSRSSRNSGARTFTFSVYRTGDVFSGTHAEISPNRTNTNSTGTLTLQAEPK